MNTRRTVMANVRGTGRRLPVEALINVYVVLIIIWILLWGLYLAFGGRLALTTASSDARLFPEAGL